MKKRRLVIGGIMTTLIIFVIIFAYAQIKNSPDVPYVPTSQKVVNKMLELAKVNKNDIVYDLGSGDGRIPISAVKDFGAKRAVGIEIDAERIKEANENAEKAGVAGKVKFVKGDIFKEDFSEATVVTLYLLPEINIKLRPKILPLKPGTRIVSHAFDMDDWQPEQTIQYEGSTIYVWTVPEKKPFAK